MEDKKDKEPKFFDDWTEMADVIYQIRRRMGAARSRDWPALDKLEHFVYNAKFPRGWDKIRERGSAQEEWDKERRIIGWPDKEAG